MIATLGGLLKDYRLQKNISQLEISFGVGWKEPSRLSRIEQGHVGRPKRPLLERIMDAMKLSEEERNRLLLVGGYLPTDEEIEKVRKKVKSLVDEWEYPASVMDYSWRVIYENNVLQKLFNIGKKQEQLLRKEKPNSITIVFDPEFILNKGDNLNKEREDYLVRMLAHFRDAHKDRTKEKWYVELIATMMNNALFKKLWQRAQQYKLDQQIVDVSHFGGKYILPTDTKKRLHLYFFIVPVFGDPRFTIEFHTPADLETFKYFEKK